MTHPARKADNLFQDVWLPDETRHICAVVREFAQDVLRPVAHQFHTTPRFAETFPRAQFDARSRAGLYATPFPANVGGRGLEFPTLVTLTVQKEQADYSRGIASALHNGQLILVGKTLDKTPATLRNKYLPSPIHGQFVGSLATTESEASSDLLVASMQTTAAPPQPRQPRQPKGLQ